MEKKNSIFSSLGPALSSQPGAASRSQSVPDQEVSALRQKVETLERALASQERKLAESRSAPPPPPPPRPPDMNAQFLLAKISELDRKLEEYARTAMLSSAQMKNVEESKISARREIEDLLKVVREQQKYSELDRQMHDQLEKSWRRVEELEKKLMDFYGAVLTRSAEDGKKAPPLQGSEVEAIVEAKLRGFLDQVDSRFRAVSEKLDAQTPAVMRKTEERLADMVNDLDSRLTSFEIDFKKLQLYISSTEESINSLYLNVKRDMLTVLKEAVKDADSAITGHMLALTAKLEEMFRRGSQEAAVRIREESDRNADKIKEFSGLAARSLSGAAFLAGNLDEISVRLEKLKTEVKTFSDGLGEADMAALLGVSGAVARKNYEGLRASLKDLESELLSFRTRKDELKENLRKLAGGGS